jgi:DNA-directed RNA polymerase specialized sigma24 family protein
MAGDHEAFSELVRLSIDRLYTIARLTLHDEEQAKDATQEALVAAWRDLSALRDPDRFDVWLRRLLVHACYRARHARTGLDNGWSCTSTWSTTAHPMPAVSWPTGMRSSEASLVSPRSSGRCS